MKRLCVFIAILFMVGTLSAQKKIVTREVDGDYVKITKIIPQSERTHDFRIGIGSMSLFSFMMLDEGLFSDVDYIEPPLRNQIINADYYQCAQYFTGVISLNYIGLVFHFYTNKYKNLSEVIFRPKYIEINVSDVE